MSTARALPIATDTALEGDRLTGEVERFDRSLPLRVARTPPASWYVHPRFWALDKEAVLQRHWIVAGRAALLEADGAFLTLEVGDCPVVVVRDGAELRAFHNVCRHHAACIADGQGAVGQARELVCPYHGWRYALDGRLLSAPASGGIKMPTEGRNLVPAHVATWGPYVFVSVADDPPSLAEQLAPLTKMLDASRWEQLTWVGGDTYEIQCNWKVVVDNYLDGGYHIPHAHRSLNAELDMSSYRTECHDTWSVQLSEAGEDGELAGRTAGGAIYAWLHPTFMVNRYGPVLDTNTIVPLGPERCLVSYDYFFEQTEGEAAKTFIEASLKNTDRVQREDSGICENVQRGLRSPAYDRGWYAATETSAVLFHQLLQDDYRAVLGLPR
jgi:choline monooxygenase